MGAQTVNGALWLPRARTAPSAVGPNWVIGDNTWMLLSFSRQGATCEVYRFYEIPQKQHKCTSLWMTCQYATA
jgi:hypothetical protein